MKATKCPLETWESEQLCTMGNHKKRRDKDRNRSFPSASFVSIYRLVAGKSMDCSEELVIVCRATESDLQGIHLLHLKNLKSNLSEEERKAEGFVSAEYNMDMLLKMHKHSPSIVAKYKEEVVGYALVVPKTFQGNHCLLDDLFETVNTLTYQNKALKDSKYVLCGQLCIEKLYRGQGLVPKLYGTFAHELKNEFDYIITDVASENPRSLKAHKKAGFEVIDSKHYDGVTWDIILLKL
jgi:ribosomal protein S18 acetylase RimI-like enzyme